MAVNMNENQQRQLQAILQQLIQQQKNQKANFQNQNIANWAMQGNDQALVGAVLGRIIKDGWNSQKRAYDEARSKGQDVNNMYSGVRNWLDGMFGRRKVEQEPAVAPSYESQREQVNNELLSKYSLDKAMEKPQWTNPGISEAEMQEIDDYIKRQQQGLPSMQGLPRIGGI